MMRKLQEAKDRLESEKNNLMYAIEVFIAIMIMPIIRRITIFTTKMVIVKMVIMMIIWMITLDKRIMMIMIIMQVLKQQNFKLEASNANLSMMSSTMSPLQVIMITNHNNHDHDNGDEQHYESVADNYDQ